MYLIFDTETTGLPGNFNAPVTDTDNWPRMVQIAWQLHDEMGEIIEQKDFLVRPEGFNIPFDSERIHGISTELALTQGESLEKVLDELEAVLPKAQFVMGHNLSFDLKIVGAELVRTGRESVLNDKPVLDSNTKKTADLCQIPGGKGGGFKLPTLSELHEYLFGERFNEAHNATADVEATARCFFELLRRDQFTLEELGVEMDYFQRFKKHNPKAIAPIGLVHVNFKKESQKLKKQGSGKERNIDEDAAWERLMDVDFAHLHNHTQFSILQASTSIDALIENVGKMNQKAVALTDNGNVMGAFIFEQKIKKYNDRIKEERAAAEENGAPFDKNEILPIIGCEFNVCKDHKNKEFKDTGYEVVLLAKNKNGYQNLIKLASIAFTDGKYYVPRIDKGLIQQYKDDLICLSGNLNGEVPNLLLKTGEAQAEESLIWYKNTFGEDFYIEIMRHGQEDEDHVNVSLIELARKHNVKLVATNNTFYPTKEDAEFHDILLCVKNNKLVSTPVGPSREERFGLPNQEYFLKSSEEMKALFLDLPEAIENINEIIEKCESYSLAREVLLPKFEIPEQFIDPQDEMDGGKRGENNYLRHLTFEGAKKRYGAISQEIEERLDFELKTIENTGYPGYFLIVQDFCQAARDMGVSVGPGRGSAAGSAVAYCTGITNIDPIKYDLLFERFLNPDRISMPDIDIDFDDEGRGKVIDYVVQKYGARQVAQIITYGTMAAKSAIRDTGRVLNHDLSDVDSLAKMVVGNLSLSFIINASEEKIKEKLNNDKDVASALKLREIYFQTLPQSEVLQKASRLEGVMRNTGVHACGVIITPSDITDYVPVAVSKDDAVCTQFDNSVAENAGLLKMDFLGLSTLTLIKDALRNIKIRHGITIDIENIPLDDEKTFELFQRGETVGIFQYESPGMQKYLKELKPNAFEDLIAMNALYRPGPLQYIPEFIKRKNGEVEITYDLPDCEEYLKETYGITVYQEQVMLLAQKLAGFSKGEADGLRKAMGKKIPAVLAKMKPEFIQRGADRGQDPEKLEKIWKDWEAFASYAFNKSHSTCYAWIAYQTAYLKANYPAEYMSAVLSNNMNDIKKVTFFMSECRRMNLKILSPDVNESLVDFTVNSAGDIRFGLNAIKGFGMAPAIELIENRTELGPYTSVYDFVERLSGTVCNKKAMECLVFSGGFDSFKDIERYQYFLKTNSNLTFLETIVSYGSAFQSRQNSNQTSLFDEGSEVQMVHPTPPKGEEWSKAFQFKKEKEVIGLYLSGHPLDDFQLEIDSFCSGKVGMLNNLAPYEGKELTIAAMIVQAEERTSQRNELYGRMTIEDYEDQKEILLFQQDYLKNRHFFQPNLLIAITGRVEKRKYREELEFRVSSIDLLSNVLEKKARTLNVLLRAAEINQMFISDLLRVCENHKGSCDLRFEIIDEESKTKLEMNSRKLKVDPSKQLVSEFRKLDLEFSLS